MLRPALNMVVMLTFLALALGGSAQAAGACRRIAHDGNGFAVCSYSAKETQIAIRWRNETGQPFASLSAVRADAERAGRPFLFAINGGMYHEDLSPVGYHVEDGEKLHNANTRPGPGNFHMRPNGIFFVEGDRVGVMETSAFLKRNRRPAFATQSGPMLVIDGRIHPIFKSDSDSQKYRSGVGVSGEGTIAHFAISDEPVTFYAFASLFKDALGTPNALFLDGGSVPQMIGTEISRPSFAPVGPVVVVTARAKD